MHGRSISFYSAAPTQWTERLGLAVMAIVVGAYFVMLMTDVAWDVGLWP